MKAATRLGETMFDPTSIGRHRWQALINGLVIGLGVGSIVGGQPLGILFIGVGIGMEYWHRQRMKRGQ